MATNSKTTAALRRDHLKRPARRSVGTSLFLTFLAIVASMYLAILIYHMSAPPVPDRDWDSAGYIDQCRELCLKYGLLPTGDIAVDAKAYLAAAKSDSAIASDDEGRDRFVHPLIGQTAPHFVLPDDEGKPRSLEALNQEGPVVVVFYYGYFCSHCVAQLFGLDADLQKFQKYKAGVVALSADSSELTATRFRQYGKFHFPVLSDADHHVAEQFGVYRRATGEEPSDQKHGTFIVDKNGKIVWAYTGDTPFVDNEALLKILATN